MVEQNAEQQESQDDSASSRNSLVFDPDDTNQKSTKSGQRGGLFFGGGGGAFGQAPMPTPQEGVWSLGVGITWSKNKDVLHGFSQATGRWATIRIDPPSQIVPIVGSNVAVVPVGSDMPGYSGTTCTWDLLQLDQAIEDGPSVGEELVTIHCADHVYTFAAALGKWTSPTDSSLNTPLPPSVEPLEPGETPEPTKHHNDGHTIAQLEEAWQHAERKTIEVAQKLQRTEGSQDELAPLKKELREAVESAFSARRMLQEARMNEMQEKLSHIRTALQSRAQRRDRIIERRVEELQDPGLNWASLRGTGASSSTVRNQPKNAAPLPLEGPAGLSSTGPVWGQPATGTPVGLPGPPNVPLESVGNTNTPTGSGDATPPTFSGSGPIAAKTLPAFDWEKAEELESRIRPIMVRLIGRRKRMDSCIAEIELLDVAWENASAAQRVEVERLLRSTTSRGEKLSVGDDYVRITEGRLVERKPIAEDQERYDDLRLQRLKYVSVALDGHLRDSASEVAILSRCWGEYQGKLGELDLRVREAELVHSAASRVLVLKTARNDAVGIDQVEMINAKLEVDRAMIGLERTKNHLKQLLRIGKDNPGFKPDQYREELARFQRLLDQVREENPELESITVPVGSGGGFF